MHVQLCSHAQLLYYVVSTLQYNIYAVSQQLAV